MGSLREPEDPAPGASPAGVLVPEAAVEVARTVDNRGATIGQQIIVQGNATFWSPAPAAEPRPRRADNLPRDRSLVFEGRDAVLATLREALADAGRVVITGLGGMGKTRLALEHAIAGDYDVRWFVRAAEIASLHKDLVALGRRLGLVAQAEVENVEQAVEVVLEWLSTHDRWLLVLDNAPGPEALRGRLPAPGRGHVLITSRAQAWPGVAVRIELDRLAPEAAAAVLLGLGQRPDDGSAAAIAEELGHLPLALVQAGAFMSATECSCRGYLEHLEAFGLGMFRDPAAAPVDYYGQTIAVTWEISLAAIRKESTAAAALLDWLAFLDPDRVPLRLLREHAEGLPAEVAACVGSSLALDRAIAVLRRFSLVDRVDEPEPALRVHRLVQAVTRDKLDDERRRRLAAAVVEWIRGLFAYEPDETPVSDVPEGSGDQVMAAGLLDACVEVRGRAMTLALAGLGHYRMLRGMLAAARVACLRALEVAEARATAAPDDAVVGRDLYLCLAFLGNVETQVGDLAAARALFQRYRELAERLAAADPHDALAQRDLSVALHKLGDVEMRAGDLGAARELFQRSLDVMAARAAADPDATRAQLDLAASLAFLGHVDLVAGDLAAARERFERAVEIGEAIVAADPERAATRRDLAASLFMLAVERTRAGDLAAARTLHERALALRQALAEDDPHSAQAQRDLSASLGFLGHVHTQAGDLDAARALFQRALAIAEALAEADPQSTQAQHDLAAALDALGDAHGQAGDLEAARALFLRSLALAEALAAEAPDGVQARRPLVVILARLGDAAMRAGELAEAREHLRRYHDLARALAEADPENAQAQRDLSIALERLGEVELRAGELAAARSLLERTLALREALAEADPESAQAQRDLSVVLRHLGEAQARAGERTVARDALERALAIARTLATTDPENALVAHDVFDCLIRLADLAEAEDDREGLRRALGAADERLAAMEAAGQLTGHLRREAAQAHVRRRLDALARG